MKNSIIFLLSVSLLVGLMSCEKEELEIWESSTAKVDGNWMMRYDHADYGVDPFGNGFTQHFIYNDAANNGESIWLEDHNTFWEYKVKLPVNLDNLTFGSTDTVINQVAGYDIKVIVSNGKIYKDAVTLPSTLVVDSIFFDIWFEDLEGATGIPSDVLHVGGYRQSGFEED